MSFFYKRGITLIELLVIIAIIGILLSVVISQFAKTKENQVLKSAVSDILSGLNKARAQTLASLDSSSYGVYFQSDKIIIFKGEIFSADGENNEMIEINAPATISDITLAGVSGSSGEIYFNRLSGTPNQTGSLTVSTPSFTKIITIPATGMASTN